LRGAVRLGEGGCHGQGKHAACHTGAAKHEQLAASESVDGEEGDEAREEFPGQGAAGEDAGDFRIESQTLLENDLVKCVSTTGLLA
jgi:hypothetical protein